jgi:hypothetical protein
VAVTIQLRRDTAANWTAANTLLAQGEIGLELVTGKFKIGDGVTHWTGLLYYDGPGGSGSLETVVFQDAGAPYVLPISPVLNQKITIIDNTGTPGIVVSTADASLINGSPTFAYFLQPYASYGFIWNGTGWRVV